MKNKKKKQNKFESEPKKNKKKEERNMWNDNEIHNESENSGGFMMDTTLSGEKSSGPKRIQNCVPLMIAHLDREDIEVWGISVRLVTFVAILRKYENVSTKVTFEFEDETGLLFLP